MGRPLYYAAVVSVFFFLLLFFLAYYQRSEIGCLLHFHAWCGLSANLECVYEICCTWLAGKIQESKIMQKLPSARHCTTLFGYIFTTKAHVDNQKKNLLNSNIFSRCPHNMVNFGPLMTEIGWRVWGTTANFNGFVVLALSLHRCHSAEINRSLHDVWPSSVMVHCIYIFGSSGPLTEFYQVQNSLCIQVLRSPILATLLHGTWAWASAKLCGMVQGM